jgi:hypothetical protein
MKLITKAAIAAASLFLCLIQVEAATHHHHRHHLRFAAVHKTNHHRYHKPEPVVVPGTIVENIRRTAEAAAPPPLPATAVQFIADMLDVVKQTTEESFEFVRNPVDEAREYVQQTSVPGYTMLLQGRPVALSCLNPEFVLRLAASIKEARDLGINASVSSACRPPVLRVGGMADKSQSMHAYGLAVDLAGIGHPGDAAYRQWCKIAAGHGIIRPYNTMWEDNHFQPTETKVASQVPPMKKLLSRYGPTDLMKLWAIEVGMIIPVEKAKAQSTNVVKEHHHAHTHIARA